jgi:hypothetical protein
MEQLTAESLAEQLAQVDNSEQPEGDSLPQAADEAQEADQDAPQQAEEADAEGEQPPEDSPAPRTLKVKGEDGEEIEVPEDEVVKGYLRQSDYTRKTQELADQARQTQAQIQQQAAMVTAMATELGELQSIQQQLDQFQKVDWNAIQSEDPQQANLLMTRFLALRQAQTEAQNKVQGKAQALQQAQAQTFQQQSAEAFEHLKKRIPKFSEQTLKDIREGCIKAGYRPDELGQINHKILLEDLWKARQWDSLQAKKPEVTNKVKNLPPPAKPTRQSAPPSQAQAVQRVLNTKKSFSLGEFAQLYKTVR